MEKKKMRTKKRTRKLKVSAAHRAALNYLEEILGEPDVKKRIADLRAHYGINEADYAHLAKTVIEVPPKEWQLRKTYDEKRKMFWDLAIEIEHMLNSFNLFQMMVSPSPLLNYVFTGKIIEMDKDARELGILPIRESHSIGSMVSYDAVLDRQEYDQTKGDAQNWGNKRRDALDKIFPIAIRINPNSSLRQLRESLARALPWIKLEHDGYIDKSFRLAKIRKKDDFKKRRDELIVEYAGRPRSEFLTAFVTLFPG